MVRPKKHLGQHFLRDEQIAQRIVGYLNPDWCTVLEVGPGMGILSKYILKENRFDPWFMEIDQESVDYLQATFPEINGKILKADFLAFDLNLFPPDSDQSMLISEGRNCPTPFTIIGNFPYNISSQILFKALDYRDRIPEVVGMFQKEVAERIASPPGNKSYGIISVLLQAYYHIDYLFTVEATVFHPPPKVKSAVIRLRRNNVDKLTCDEALFTRLVKTAFNQRRKTLRNAIRPMIPPALNDPANQSPWLISTLDLRAERLSVDDFVRLATEISTFA